MRGLDTNVKRIRRKVFKEIARVGFESEPETLVADIEAIPYHIVQERATYRESIYRERAVASERVRLAMGMRIRQYILQQGWKPAILTKSIMSRLSCR